MVYKINSSNFIVISSYASLKISSFSLPNENTEVENFQINNRCSFCVRDDYRIWLLFGPCKS